jgi:hypothetical protein
MMIRAALPINKGGLDSDVLFITTVQKISLKRVEQLLKIYSLSKKELDNIYSKFHIEHFEYDEFDKFLSTIHEYINNKKIKMLIIDSITGLCDVQFIKENNEVDYVNRTLFLKR